MEQEKKYRQIGNTLFMMKTLNFKETKTCLVDLISTTSPVKPSVFQRTPLCTWIQQPIHKPSSIPIVYDEFIYTDKLTKKRIKMYDAKMSYETGRNARDSFCSANSHNTQNQDKRKRPSSRFVKHTSQTELEKQMTDLNDCFVMLKSTQLFKLNSLRQKIFGSIDRSAKQTAKETPKGNSTEITAGEIKDMMTKKKKIRQILQDSVKQANITEFRKYFSDQNHKLNSKILAMNRRLPRSFNKNNVQKIIQKLTDADKKDQSICNFIKKEEEDIQFPGQQKLRIQLIEYMKKLLRHNGQYLVTPEKKKLLYQRLHKNIGLQSNELNNTIHNRKLTCEQSLIQQIDQNSFDEGQAFSKVNIQIPTEKSILEPVVNNDQTLGKKDNLWTKSLCKTSGFKDFQQKKKSEYPISNQQKKQKHKKQNSCINLTTHALKFKTKEGYRPTTSTANFLNSFAFSPCEKNKQISMIKTKFQKNKRLRTIRLSLKEQKFLFMVENGLLFDVEKQILMNEEYLFMKDKNENNLLHICSKNHFTEMFTFIVERYAKCGLKEQMREKWGEYILKDKLMEKNKYNKTVFDVARLYHAKDIIMFLSKLKEDMNIRQYNA